MAIQTIERNDLFGRIGKNVGQGLSEQLPKEMERTRLSQGLKKFAENSSGLTPLQQYAQVAGFASDYPSLIQALPEVLKQENVYKESRERLEDAAKYKKDTNTNTQNIVGTPSGQQTSENFSKKYGFDPATLSSKDDILLAQDNRPFLTKEQHDAETYDLMKKYPTKFRDESTARAEVDRNLKLKQDEFDSVINTANTKVGLQDSGKTAFNAGLEKITGKQGPAVNQDFPDKYQELARNRITQAIKDGVPPEKAAQRELEKIRSFTESQSKLLSGPESGIIGDLSSKQQQFYKDLRKSYEAVGALELMNEQLRSVKQVGPYMSNSIVYPNSPSIAKSLEKLPRVKQNLDPLGPTRYVDKDIEKKAKSVIEKNADSILDSMKPDDSYYSTALELQRKGYPSDVFIQKAKQRFNDNPDFGNERQRKELEDFEPYTFTLGDIFFSAWNDLFGEKDYVPTQEKIRKFMGKQ